MANGGSAAGRTSFCPSGEPLGERVAFARHLARATVSEWVVYAKRPFAGPQQVLDYVGRYTHRVAISNHRLLDIENDQVRFQWKDYRDGQVKTMTLRLCPQCQRGRMVLVAILPRSPGPAPLILDSS